MNILTIAISAFIILELLNVLALYFKPSMKQANAVGMFKVWEKTKKDSESHNLVRYLTYWVAGSKLIFIALLIVILIWGDEKIQFISTIALVLTISTYYWKLDPLISKMDVDDEIDPKGYSKTLRLMIFIFILILAGATLYEYLKN